MFGKLFSYLALARSGLLEGEEAVSMEVMARLLELHKKRNWMREVVSEAILVIMWSMPPSLVEDKVLTLLANTDTDQVVGLGSYGTGTNLALADTPLEEYTPWQLQLAIGLQLYASEHGEEHKSVKKLVRALAPGETKKVCTADTLPSLETTLLGATAGFPKVHRVWDYVLGQVFGMSGSDRSLPVQRVEGLGSKQLALLQGIITFIESQLMPASHERRSLAYRLTVTLARLTPAEHMPLVLSPVVLRGLARARINKKHILNRLAARSIIDIVEAVQDDAKCRLLVASTLVQHGAGGGLHFDAFTQRMITLLMEGLGADDVKTFIKSLAGIVANTSNQSENTSSSSSAKKEETPKKAGKKAGKKAASASKKGDDEEEDDGEDEEEEETEEDLQLAAERAALAAIEALAALAKTSSLSHRSEAMVQIVSLFLRVGCFGAGQAKASGGTGSSSSSSSKGKRGGKKGSKNADADTVVALSDDCMAMFDIAEGSGKVSYPESVVAAAAGKLLAILSDAGNSTLAALDGDSNGSTDRDPTLVMVTVRMAFFLCSSCGVALHQKTLSSTAAVSGMVASMEQDEDDDDDAEGMKEDKGEGGEDSIKSVFLRAFAVMQSDALSVSTTKAASAAPTGKKGAKSADTNVHGWLHLLLGHASMMMLCAANEISATVSELSTVCPLVAALADGKAPACDDDDEDEEEATAELLSGLLDATLELVSYSGDSAVTVKGIRESSRRVWGALGRSITITLPLLESVVEAVIGDDVEEEEEEDEADAHDDGSDAMDEEEEKGASRGKANGKGKGKGAKKGEEEEEEEEDEEEEEEDEIIGADEALDLLATEESDSEDELERLQGMVSETMHNEGADAALMSMLELRKQNRKAGLLLAKRKQCVIRSRALDILEALLVKADSAELLMPLLPPLLVCVRRLQSGLAQNLQEGQAFEERLRSFIETRLAKKHFVLLAEGDVEVEEGVVQLVLRVCDGLKIDLTCSSMPMRRMAQAVLLCVTRACAGSDVPAAQTVLAECVKSLLSLYFSKKNARLSSALFDEFVTRYPDFTVMHLMPLFVSAPAAEDTKGAFLRTEGVRYLSSTLRRFVSLSEASKAQVGSSVTAICVALGTFLASLVGDGGDAGANAKRIKPVLQCVRELAQLPVCKGKIDELRNAGAATAANGKKGSKKNGKKEAAAAAGPSFDDAAAALVSAVEKAAAAGNSQQQQSSNTPTGKGSNAVSNVATQALTALGAMGLKVTMPAPAAASSNSATTTPSKGDKPKPEGSSNKKQKKLTRLDEEELKYLKKQQQIMQEQEDEQEKQGNTAAVDAAAEAKLNKWFEEPAKQERRKKTKREQ
jgi:hypothetical protein